MQNTKNNNNDNNNNNNNNSTTNNSPLSSPPGSLLGVMLLLPGLAMLLGGLKFKEQRFSRSAAGVSSVLLLLSVVAAFLPTLYFVIFGASQMFCGDCDYDTTSMGGTDTDSGGNFLFLEEKKKKKKKKKKPDSNFIIYTILGEYNAECGFCYNRRVDLAFDPVYDKAEHLSFASAFLMPVAYCLGLIFTLKTHTHIYDIPEDDDEEKAGFCVCVCVCVCLCLPIFLSCFVFVKF